MKMRRVSAIALKELLQVWRDPRSLMLALLMPVLSRWCSLSWAPS